MCYTIYLYHTFAISLLGRMTVRLVPTTSYALSLLAQIGLVAVPTIVACSLLFVALERPFMRQDWPSRWAAAMRPGSRTRMRGADAPGA
jgi:peptidoglycan/LPS O-acetylase OafA/YrhL